MMKIITTVGTSLFTNYTKGEVKDSFINDDYQDIGDALKELEKVPSSEYSDQRYYPQIRTIKSVIETKWIKGIVKKNDYWEIKEGEFNLDASAEIKSLVKITSQIKQNYKIYLLYSDSVLSQLAAEILKENLPTLLKQDIKIHCDLIENLVVDSFEKFNIGLINLVKKIREIFKNEFNLQVNNTFTIETKQKISDEFIFNISGGYKAVIPFLTILAQLYNIESKYIFEESDEVITIPHINIGIDELFIEKFYLYLENVHLNIPAKSYEEIMQLEILKNYRLIENNNGRYKLTVLGEMVKDYVENLTISAKKVFGYIVEFKLYEYFINNPLTINGFRLKKVKRNAIFKKEFDIVLSNEKDDFLCFCEVKAIYSFLKNKDKILFDLKERISAIKDYFPHSEFEYHFYIYSLNNNYIPLAKIIENAKEIKNKYSNIIFKFFHVYVKEVKDDKERKEKKEPDNPYQKIVKSKIESNDITEIKL